MIASPDENGQIIPSEDHSERPAQQPRCVTCGSDEHTTINCPHYSAEDRELMLLGAELFVHGCTNLGDYGQNCLNDFAAALQPNEDAEDLELECTYCGLPMNPNQMCSSPIGDVHESCYNTMEEIQDDQF